MDHWDTGMSPTRIKAIERTNTPTKTQHRPMRTTNIRIIIRLNDSASVLDAKMMLENASETRDKITIHTTSLTAIHILNNRKLDLNTVTRAIRDAASRLTQRPTTNWIHAHTRIPGNENADQGAKRGLQLDRIHTTVNTSTFREQTRMKEQIARHYNEKSIQWRITTNKRPQMTIPDWQLKEEANVNVTESTTFYMKTEHEMSNILTSDNRTTTEMQVV